MTRLTLETDRELTIRAMELKENTVIVVLGASGDLAKKKTVRTSILPSAHLGLLANFYLLNSTRLFLGSYVLFNLIRWHNNIRSSLADYEASIGINSSPRVCTSSAMPALRWTTKSTCGGSNLT